MNTFTAFPRLPVELRLAIWKLSYPRGRIIHLDIERAWWKEVENRLPNKLGTLPPAIGGPTIVTELSQLYVNHESRNLVLEEYKLVCFPGCRYPTYTNRYNDIFLFSIDDISNNLIPIPYQELWCWAQEYTETLALHVRNGLGGYYLLPNEAQFLTRGHFLLVLEEEHSVDLNADYVLEQNHRLTWKAPLRPPTVDGNGVIIPRPPPHPPDVTLIQYDSVDGVKQTALQALQTWVAQDGANEPEQFGVVNPPLEVSE